MLYFHKYPAFLSLLLLTCCSGSPERKDVTLPDSSFVYYLADSLILDERRKIDGIDSSHWALMVDSLRIHHRCDLPGLRLSHSYYSSEITLTDSLISMLIRRIEFIQQESLKTVKLEKSPDF